MKKTLFLFLIFFSNLLFSQIKQEEVTANFIANNPYFKVDKEEQFFLHTNKTVYFSGEKVWFAAYILDKSSERPSKITTNLHINLYGPDFKLITQKLFYAENGKSHGQFELLESLPSGNYYIEVDTNWNRNFKKGTITKIEIINLKNQQEETTSISEKEIEKTSVKNKHDFLISRNLKKRNSSIFKIKSTKSIIDKYTNETLFAVLHKNGALRSCAPINIDNKKSYTIKFDPTLFFNGANTVTLFDKKNTIIAEKHFWNFDTKIGKLEIEETIKKKDTLYLKLKLPKDISNPNMSVSVLNNETKLIPNQNNILNSFLGGDFNQIKKYTKKSEVAHFLGNRASSFRFNNKKNQSTYNNESGIKIRGKVNSKISNTANYKVALNSKENEIFLIDDLHKDTSFEFKNLHLKHPTEYKLTLLNKGKKQKGADLYIYDDFYNYKADSILKLEKEVFNNAPVIQKNDAILNNSILFKEEKDVTKLEEVIVKSFVDKKEKVRKKYKNIIGANFSTFHIPDESVLGIDIFFYLHSLPGMRVNYVPLTNLPLIFNTRGAKSITGDRLVQVKLNGVFLGNDLSPLTGLLTTDFEVIIVNLSGSGEGLRGSNGVVNLILKHGASQLPKNKTSKIQRRPTTKGFEISLHKYIKPTIKFNDINLKRAYSTIDWIPNLKPNSEQEIILKIPVLKQQNKIKLIINGFDENGILIHDDIIISNN